MSTLESDTPELIKILTGFVEDLGYTFHEPTSANDEKPKTWFWSMNKQSIIIVIDDHAQWKMKLKLPQQGDALTLSLMKWTTKIHPSERKDDEDWESDFRCKYVKVDDPDSFRQVQGIIETNEDKDNRID